MLTTKQPLAGGDPYLFLHVNHAEHHPLCTWVDQGLHHSLSRFPKGTTVAFFSFEAPHDLHDVPLGIQ